MGIDIDDGPSIYAASSAGLDSRNPRWPRTLVLAWGLVLLLYLAIVPTGVVSSGAADAINDGAWTAAAALAAFSCMRAARSVAGWDRLAWLMYAGACAAWTVGQVVWTVNQFEHGTLVPFPSYADAGYLLFGPFMAAGLLLLRATQRERHMSWVRVANLGLILCSLAVVLTNTLMQPFQETARPFGTSIIVLGESATITIAFILAVYFLWSYEWGIGCSLTASSRWLLPCR